MSAFFDLKDECVHHYSLALYDAIKDSLNHLPIVSSSHLRSPSNLTSVIDPIQSNGTKWSKAVYHDICSQLVNIKSRSNALSATSTQALRMRDVDVNVDIGVDCNFASRSMTVDRHLLLDPSGDSVIDFSAVPSRARTGTVTIAVSLCDIYPEQVRVHTCITRFGGIKCAIVSLHDELFVGIRCQSTSCVDVIGCIGGDATNSRLSANAANSL